MHQDDELRFSKALAEMALMFADEVSKPRARLYWELFRDSVTIAEWEYACMQAITRETFHKVPLPAHLMTYVEEYRSARLRQIEERWQANQQTLETAERLALEADPEWQAAQQHRKEELRRIEEEAYQVLARKWGPGWKDEPTRHQIPSHVAGEEWTYAPSADPAQLRAQALAKVEQLKAQLAQEREEKEQDA